MTNHKAVADDPSLKLPVERLEKSARIQRGLYRPNLEVFPTRTIGKSQNARNRSFSTDWYKDFNWLEYSPVKDAAFCFPCRYFTINSSITKGQNEEDAFTEKVFTSWNKAAHRFKLHQQTKCHVSSVSCLAEFQSRKSCRSFNK